MRQPVDVGLDPTNARYLMANYNQANNNFKATSANGITLSVWVKRTQNTGGAEQGILGRYNWGQNGRQAMIALNGSDQIRLFRSINGTNASGQETNFGNQSMGDGEWFHLAATLKNGSQILYVNGTQDVAQTTAAIGSLDSIWPTKSQLSFGRMAPDHTGNPVHQAFDGYLDEARYTRVVRSPDWIKLEWASQRSGQTVTDVGANTTPDAPTGVAGTTGAKNTGSVILTWSPPAYNGGADVTSYKAMAVSDTSKMCVAYGATGCTVAGLTAGASYTFVVRAYNIVGASALSSASAAVNAPVPVLGGALLRHAGFTGAHTFRLSEGLAAVTGRLEMRILDVSGRTVWSRSVSPAEAGRTIRWDGATRSGARASAGIYFARVYAVTPDGRLDAVQGGVTLGD
jgi:hypothetical protein